MIQAVVPEHLGSKILTPLHHEVVLMAILLLLFLLFITIIFGLPLYLLEPLIYFKPSHVTSEFYILT